jgi:hypothetical protein
MADPERLLRGVDADGDAELERELLRSIVDVSPPAGAQDDAWDGVAARIAAASAVAAGVAVLGRAGTAASGAPGGVSALKLAAQPVVAGVAHAFATKVVVGALVAVTATAAAGGLWSKYRRAPHLEGAAATPDNGAPRAATAPSPVAPPTSMTRVAVPGAPPEPTTGVAVPAAPPEEGVAPPKSDARAGKRVRSGDALAVESALLTEARASLRSGNADGALAALRRLDTRAPHGVLSQEREVLTIEALAASGDRATASRRAAAFVQANPNSPHTPSLRRLADDP